MKLSVVTISYNQCKFLRACVDSVQSQTGDFEHICVDPGSTDGSREILESYGDSIYRIFERDNGPANGLNKGFAKASGDIFCFINSDDVLLPNAAAVATRIFSQYPDVDVLLGSGILIDQNGEAIRNVYASRFTSSLYVRGCVTLFQQGMFFRASSFRHVGGFNEKNRSCWDAELALDFALSGQRFKRTFERLGGFRLHPSSITVSQRLRDIYIVDHERMAAKANPGRPEKAPNGLAKFLIKFLADPAYYYKRIFFSGF